MTSLLRLALRLFFVVGAEAQPLPPIYENTPKQLVRSQTLAEPENLVRIGVADAAVNAWVSQGALNGVILVGKRGGVKSGEI